MNYQRYIDIGVVPGKLQEAVDQALAEHPTLTDREVEVNIIAPVIQALKQRQQLCKSLAW